MISHLAGCQWFVNRFSCSNMKLNTRPPAWFAVRLGPVHSIVHSLPPTLTKTLRNLWYNKPKLTPWIMTRRQRWPTILQISSAVVRAEGRERETATGVFAAPRKKSCYSSSSYHDVGGGGGIPESHFYKNAGLTVTTLAIVRSRMTEITGPVLIAEKTRTFVSIRICGVLVGCQTSGAPEIPVQGSGAEPGSLHR